VKLKKMYDVVTMYDVRCLMYDVKENVMCGVKARCDVRA